MAQTMADIEFGIFQDGLFASEAELSMADSSELAAETDGHLILEQQAEFLKVAAQQLVPGTRADLHTRHRIGAAAGVHEVLTNAKPAILGAHIELRQEQIAGKNQFQ